MAILRSKETTDQASDVWPSPRSREAWSALGWLGLAFVILGIADIVLGVFPPSFDSTEWVFGTISAVLNGYAIPAMGAFLFLASGLARGTRLQLQITWGLMLLVGIVMAGLGMLYLTVAPIALDSVRQNADAFMSMKKGIGKGFALVIAYTILHIGGAVKGWIASNHRD